MLTPQRTLREWMLTVLASTPAAKGRRAAVLDRMEREFGHLLTEEDRESPVKRPFETKWRNRASYERAAMVREGLLSPRADGFWELTALGLTKTPETARGRGGVRDQ